MQLNWTYLFIHLSSVVSSLLTLVFAAALLRERRPPGSAVVWLVLIVLVPFVGIPLYMIFGRRKFKHSHVQRANSSFTHIQIIENGVVAFEALEKALQNSNQTIAFQTFIFKWDETGQRIFKVLCERARAGVRVYLLMDGFGQLMGSRIANRVPRELREQFRVAIFSPPLASLLLGSVNQRNHRKLVIIDGKEAFVGGMNIASEYMGPLPRMDRWQDFVFPVQGEIVGSLSDGFSRDWIQTTKQHPDLLLASAPITDRKMLCTPSGPNLSDDPIYDQLLWRLCRAHKSISIVTPYFIPDEALIKVLTVAAGGGLRVRLIVPKRSNHPMTDLARGSALRDLKIAGVDVLCFPRMIHAKLVVIDGEQSLIGSANFDIRSLLVNYELGLWVDDAVFSRELDSKFDQLAAQCDVIQVSHGRAREVFEGVVRLVSPML